MFFGYFALLKATCTSFDLSPASLSNFSVPETFDITGVSLPNASTNTTPNWYSLSDFTDFLGNELASLFNILKSKSG